MSRIIYYYQTFCGLDKILVDNTPVTNIHLSSIHFGYDYNEQPYIHLNNLSPYHPDFDKVWSDLNKADKLGIKNILMVGGAGGGYASLFEDFDTNYCLLYHVLKNKPCIHGVDLDIEEPVSLDNARKFIAKLIEDFGEDFIITCAPVQSSLEQDVPGMGGFCYKDLLNSPEGKHIKYINGQFYGDYSLQSYDAVIKNGYDSSMIVMGTMNSDVFDTVKKVAEKYGDKFGGVFFWEMAYVEPDPLTWAKQVAEDLRTFTLMTRGITIPVVRTFSIFTFWNIVWWIIKFFTSGVNKVGKVRVL